MMPGCDRRSFLATSAATAAAISMSGIAGSVGSVAIAAPAGASVFTAYDGAGNLIGGHCTTSVLRRMAHDGGYCNASCGYCYEEFLESLDGVRAAERRQER